MSLGDKASPPKENTLRTNCGRRGLVAATERQLLTQENRLVDSETFCQLVSEHSRSLDIHRGPRPSGSQENKACSPGAVAAVAQGRMPRAGGESWAALMCGVT